MKVTERNQANCRVTLGSVQVVNPIILFSRARVHPAKQATPASAKVHLRKHGVNRLMQ
jgi:hypothetical protein